MVLGETYFTESSEPPDLGTKKDTAVPAPPPPPDPPGRSTPRCSTGSRPPPVGIWTGSES